MWIHSGYGGSQEEFLPAKGGQALEGAVQGGGGVPMPGDGVPIQGRTGRGTY